MLTICPAPSISTPDTVTFLTAYGLALVAVPAIRT